MFRKKDSKEPKINWNDERYHPFSTRDVPTPGDAMKPPRPVGIPHYSEWIKYRPVDRDCLLAAAKCQFMDVRQGALSGRIFISVNMYMYIIDDRENPDRDIYGWFGWNEVAGWGFGVKELIPQHPFYRVNSTFTIQGANSVRIVTESRKKKGQYYVHNITGVAPSYFQTFAGMLDAVFRYHHKLPKPAGYDLTTPPQTDIDEQSLQSQIQATATPQGPPPQQLTPLGATVNPNGQQQMMGMNQTMMGMNNTMVNPGMMNPSMGMNSGMMNPSMMGMNPMMNQMMMNPMMMQQMQQNPMLMQQMMQQNPALMQQMMMQRQQQQMMMMQQNPQLRQQLMATQVPGQAPAGIGANMLPSDQESLRQTQMQPPGVIAPAAPPPQVRAVSTPSGQIEARETTEDDELFVKKQEPKKMEPFKLCANAGVDDEWSERLPSLPTVEWSKSPVRFIALTPKTQATAEELLASKGGKEMVDFGESFVADSGEMYNLDFGYPGSQVPVEQDLKQKIIFATAESQKFSFKIIKRKHPKFRFNAEPSEGTLSKSAIEIELTLKMGCTTSVELQIPVLFWHGTLKDYDRVLAQSVTGGGEKQIFVGYLNGKMQSQLSTRLDIEEVLLYKPAIGNGAFGTVYKGRYRGLDVACKLLKDQDDLTQEMFDDFRGEVKMFETLRHPCIVNFVGAVFFPGSLALVTELCQYGSLPSAMKKYGPKVWNTQMKIKAMFDCARAMDFLHQSSIIHRDLKPDNLLATSLEVHSPAVCKLSDFGTTKGANSMMRDMKMTKGIGTPLYMAPEMMRGTEGYTTKADVYSFGIMIASVIDDGIEPYAGDARIQSSWQFTNLVIQGLRPQVKKESEMPPQFINLMKRCWDNSPSIRPSFDQIVTELDSMLSHD